ncbi:TldD/PmbA family protein [Streptomyces sp. HK10]|uniref:TldD/PmbA family protein n=1 Tax=Streptomyces sp. HK10 TaxID=3373255 RepID=UPI003747EAD3
MNAEELLEIATGAVCRAPAQCAVEVFISHSTDVTAKVAGGRLEQFHTSDSSGAGVRVIRDGRLGFAGTTDLTPDGLRRAVRAASDNAIGIADAAHVLPEPAAPAAAPLLLPAGWVSAVPEAIVAAAFDLDRLTMAAHRDVQRTAPVMVGQEVSRTAIASNLGVRCAHERSDAYATVSAVARRGEERQTGLGFSLHPDLAGLDLEHAAREAAWRSAGQLGAVKPRTGEAPIVLDPLATARLLAAIAPALSGESVHHGTSLWRDLTGERIASPVLSLVDDGTLPGGPATAPVDDEGVPCRRTPLVEDGRLRGFLHSTESAARAAAGTRSTGNGRRTGFRSQPGVLPGNLHVTGPTTPRRELLNGAGDALYVLDLKGAHSGVSTVTGDVSVGVKGHWLHGGEPAEPVRELTLATSLDQLLGSVTSIGDDLRFFPLEHSVGGATLACGPVPLSGA